MGADVAVAVVAVARTAVRPVDGELAGWNPVELAGVVGREVLERAGLDAGVVDEVVVGCADPVGAAGADAARAIVLAAGWPVSVGGHVIDRGETSGLAAVQAGVAAIQGGQARTVLVVGLGLCSVVPPGAAALNRTYGAPWGGVAERFADVGGLLPGPRLTERAARAAGIGRAELDAAAEESRRRRAGAGSPTETAAAAGAGSKAGAGAETETAAAAGAGSKAGAGAETETAAAAGAGSPTETAAAARAGSPTEALWQALRQARAQRQRQRQPREQALRQARAQRQRQRQPRRLSNRDSGRRGGRLSNRGSSRRGGGDCGGGGPAG